MPYKSDAHRRYFNANRDELESQGVDVDHWNDVSRGLVLPEHVNDTYVSEQITELDMEQLDTTPKSEES